jgi:hypothetical protein
MDAAGFLDRLRSTAVPIDAVQAPTKPGVYAWFLDEPTALPTLPNQGADPIYVGMSSNLAQRGDENHFRNGGSGFSTLRRSLGPLLKQRLDLRAQPRGRGAGDQNYRCYRFDDAGEDRLTKWMHRHLRVAVAAHPEPDDIERELIACAQPPLNLTRWSNPHAVEINALRKACVEEARHDHPRDSRAGTSSPQPTSPSGDLLSHRRDSRNVPKQRCVQTRS